VNDAVPGETFWSWVLRLLRCGVTAKKKERLTRAKKKEERTRRFVQDMLLLARFGLIVWEPLWLPPEYWPRWRWN